MLAMEFISAVTGIPAIGERQLVLFADYMRLCIENAKDATRQLLELINEYGTVTRHKINTQKYLSFLYTSNEKSKKEVKELIPFTIASKRIKCLVRNIPNETKDMYVENYDTSGRNQRGQDQMEIHTMLLDWKNQYYENNYIAQSNL